MIPFETSDEEEAYKMGLEEGIKIGYGEGFNTAYEDCVKIVLKRLEKLLSERNIEWTR